MSMDKPKFQWKVLIVEDDEDWFAPMKQQLKALAGDAVHADTVTTAEAARIQRRDQRYHLISYDMKMPESENSPLQVDTGRKLAEDVIPSHRLTLSMILSGTLLEPGGSQAIRMSGVQDAQMFEKRASDLPSATGFPLMSAKEWAQEVLKSLAVDGEYWRHYWRIAAQFLPPPLSTLAHKMQPWIETPQGQVDQNMLTDLIQFWEWVLRLAWMQTLVLARHAGTRLVSQIKGGEISEKEREFSRWLETPSLDRYNWWSYTHGTGKAIEQASALFRKTRNENVHTYHPRVDYANHFQEMREPLLFLMDVAAFWSDYPLFGDISPFAGTWQAKLLRGTSDLWTTETLRECRFDAPPLPDQVFQLVPIKTGNGRWELERIDWSPFMVLEPNSRGLRLHPWLLSHPARIEPGSKYQAWLDINLLDGRTRKKDLPSNVWNIKP